MILGLCRERCVDVTGFKSTAATAKRLLRVTDTITFVIILKEF